jgi:hypothetical protein
MRTDNKQRLFEVMKKTNPDFNYFKEEKHNYDWGTSGKDNPDKINREINVELNKKRDENAYSAEEIKITKYIDSELEKIGLVDGVDFNRDQPQDAYGTKTERFGYLFWINKLKEKFGHTNIDSLLSKTNLDVQNPMVGSQVHGYILRNIRLKQ